MSDNSLLPWWVIWRAKWVMLVSVSAAVGLALLYLRSAEPVYEGRAKLLVRQEGLSFETDASYLKDRQFLATEAEVFKGSKVWTRAFQQFQPTLPDDYPAGPFRFVLESLTVTPSPVADVLTISYRGRSPEEVVELIHAGLESYQALLSEQEGIEYVSTVKTLSEREQKIRDELAGLQKDYESLRQNSPLVGQGPEALSLHVRQLTTLGDRLALAKSRKFEVEKKLESFVNFQRELPTGREPARLVAAGEIDGQLRPLPKPEPAELYKIVSLSYTGFGDAALQNSAAAQMFRQQAESKLAQMHNVEQQLWSARAGGIRKSITAEHPSYDTMSDELQHWETLVSEHRVDWDRFLNEQIQALTEVLEMEVETARQTEQELTQLYEEAQAEAKRLDAYLMREELAQRNIQRLEGVHETLLARLSDFRLADEAVSEGRGSISLQLLEAPEDNCKKVWPLPPFVLAGSVLFGLAGGLFPTMLLAGGLQRRTERT